MRAQFGDEATIVAGGTFIGIIMNQKIMLPQTLLSLRNVSELAFIEADQNEGSLLRIGAMTTHRAVERSPLMRQGWPVLASTFALVASPRVRNQATVGGVLADADYASDPPTLLQALNARVVARSGRGGEREIPVEQLITGYYETSLRPDELTLPTPCSDWNVRQLVEHMIGTNRAFAAGTSGQPLNRESAGPPPRDRLRAVLMSPTWESA